MSNSEITETSGGATGGAGAGGDGGEDDIFNQAKEAVDELVPKMQQLTDAAVVCIDSIPLEKRKSKVLIATYEYLLGRLPDATTPYKPYLEKALKANPSLGEAWLSFADYIWERRDAWKAAYEKAPSNTFFCEAYMLQTQIYQEYERYIKLIDDIVKHAKDAVDMDVTDGCSWYNLGNAYLNSFLFCGGWDLKELKASLQAYLYAEIDVKMKYSPDLPFNTATVHRYAENYELALNAFEASESKEDPSLKATEEIQNMVALFDTVENILIVQTAAKRHWESHNSKMPVLIQGLDAIQLDPPTLRRATLDVLKEGVREGVAVVGKVLCYINTNYLTPLYFILLDSKQTVYLLSVYGAHGNTSQIELDRELIIENPSYRHQDFSWKGKRYQFESLRLCPDPLPDVERFFLDPANH